MKPGDLFPESTTVNNARKCGVPQGRPSYSGNITLIVRDKASERRVNVFMKLCEKCPKHYAILYRSEDCKFQYGCFNYVNCDIKRVPENELQFDVLQKKEDVGLRFEAPCLETAETWKKAFRCVALCPYSPINRRASSCVLTDH